MKRTGIMICALGFLLFAPPARADWTTAKRLTWTAGGSMEPNVVLDSSGHLHLVWYDDTPGHNEVYYKKSTDGGTTWTPAKRLTWGSHKSYFPHLAVDSSDQLHLVWVKDFSDTPRTSDIYYRRSTDGGDTWTPTQRRTFSGLLSWYPEIAVDPWDVIHLVWQDSTGEIYYTKSPDGTNWMTEKRLTWTSGTSKLAKIAVDSSGGLHVVWVDDTPAKYNFEIYYKKSTDAGTTWSTAKRLTWLEHGSLCPVLAIDPSDNLHLAWEDESPDPYEIYFKRSTDGGASWTPAKRLTFTSGWSAQPCLTIDPMGHLHLVWEEATDDFVTDDLSYRASTDGGVTWRAVQRLTWTSGSSRHPAIITDPSSNLHLFWSDQTPGNWEIYYKKGD
jgi:BNR repeat-like domain